MVEGPPSEMAAAPFMMVGYIYAAARARAMYSLTLNFLAALTFVLRSFVSMLGDRRISLISMIFWFFRCSFSRFIMS